MASGFLVRLRPAGPWRAGPDSGLRAHVDRVFHSDRLYAAVSWAMAQTGQLEDWLAASFQNGREPAVRFSSLFPFQDDLLFVIPPRSLWPPLASPKVRWKGARFVPLPVVRAILADQPPDEDQWIVDGLSECLVPADRPRGPFRVALRSNAAVDRLSGAIEVHATSCLEFSPGGGLWAAAAFADEEAAERWAGPVRGAFRLLADSGFGGRRSLGWGRCEAPEFVDGALPDLILPATASPDSLPDVSEPQPTPETVYWLLSLLSPSPKDAIDWKRGNYSVLTRAGRVASSLARGELKKPTRMVAEGSVLFADAPVLGMAEDVAPGGFPHPVYRAGFAFAVPIPWRGNS